MWIFFSILKVIGCVLAVLLAVLLLVIGYVLFFPIVYTANLAAHDDVCASFSAYDPLRLVFFEAGYRRGSIHKSLRLLWGLLKKGGSESEKETLDDEAEPEAEKADTTEPKAEKPEASESKIEEPEASESKIKEPVQDEPALKEPDTKPAGTVESTAKSMSGGSTKWREPRPPREPNQNIRPPRPPREPGEEGKPKRPKSRIEKLRYILSIPDNQKAIGMLWRGSIVILSRIRPHIKKADIHFSTGLPDRTGELIGVLSLWPGVYEDSVIICPDFECEDAYILGEAALYGRVQLYYIAFFALRVFINRNCRRLYRQLREL